MIWYAVGFIYHIHVYIYIRIYIIYPEKARVLFHYNCAVLGFAQIIEYIMARWSYSLVWTLPYLIIIIMQIFRKVFNFWNACKVHSVECVPKIKPVLSTKSLVMIVKYTCSLSYYYHQIGRMNHLALFRVRSWNNGMRCMSFYVLIMTSWHWKNFPHDPPFVEKIHQLSVDTPVKLTVSGALEFRLLSSSRITWTNSRISSDMRRDGAHQTSLWCDRYDKSYG